jgi:hypothetical protein
METQNNMQLSDLQWTSDNSPGYIKDRFVSQWLVPPAGNGDYAHGAYRIVKRVRPHVRAGFYSIRTYDRPYGSQKSPTILNHQYAVEHGGTLKSSRAKLLDELEVACFIANLTVVPQPKLFSARWWLRVLGWKRA